MIIWLLACFGPDFHVCRRMSLPIQLGSFLGGHLLVHFGLSFRSIPKLAPKQSLRRSSRRLSRLHAQVFARMARVIFAWPLARPFYRVSQIHPQISSNSDSGEIQSLATLRTIH